jgi:hypothetical protein
MSAHKKKDSVGRATIKGKNKKKEKNFKNKLAEAVNSFNHFYEGV